MKQHSCNIIVMTYMMPVVRDKFQLGIGDMWPLPEIQLDTITVCNTMYEHSQSKPMLGGDYDSIHEINTYHNLTDMLYRIT